MALVVGHLRQHRWEDDRGNKRSKVEILSNQVMFGKGSDSENQPHVDEDMPF
jgi:single-stranded DNA-binding protein